MNACTFGKDPTTLPVVSDYKDIHMMKKLRYKQCVVFRDLLDMWRLISK